MLGYLRPRLKKSSARIREQYRALYCGLCHSLKKHYGYRGIACLNYEVTFLLLLIISASERESEIFHGSCCLTPFVRVPFIDYLNREVKTAADISVVVSGFEIKDNVNDGEAFIWRMFDRLLNKLNEKAVNEISEFEKQIKARLNIFYELEKSEAFELDEIFGACGNIVESFAGPLLSAVDGPIAEIISKIANYIGQWIYLMDACDDYQKDISTGNYNPLRYTNDYQIVYDKVIDLQAHIDELVSVLPLNKYGELLQYFSGVCIPENSNKILEKYERRLAL